MILRTLQRAVRPAGIRGQAGLTLLEVIVAMALMAIVAGSMSTLVGAAIRSKLIINVRSADTQTARQTLEWMSERLRNAGLNVNPNAAAQSSLPARCRDRVVAQDSTLRPTATQIFVTGEVLNTDTIAGNELMTIGYFLSTVGGNQVVMEYRDPCVNGTPTMTVLSDPKINVTSLNLRYYAANGTEVTSLTSAPDIRRIHMVWISLTVEGTEGRSGVQRQTWSRGIMLRNPEPYANSWINPNEVNPP
jgi:prepilin-type N-terminal cleavage/methylation domain-containing protein